MKITELQKRADNVTKRIQCHFLNTNGEFIMPKDMSFMEEFTKDVWSLCRLSWDSGKWRKVSDELPNKPCEVLVKDSMANMYIAYFSNSEFILDRYVQINGCIEEWKPID